jgi:DNA-directed RNA polymerase subunit E'/Rpb7
METISKQIQQKKRREVRIQNVYSRCLLTRKVGLHITTIGKNLKETIEENIKTNYEGKCVVEGYIKTNSTNIITYSSGIIQRGNSILFEVVFECDVCFPVEGMIISCIAKNITKAGIRAESANDIPSPVVVFVAKDHHYNMAQFSEVKEGDKINISVIGQRFELNDKYISIIGKLVKDKENIQNFKKQQYPKQSAKPRLLIED